MSDPIRWLDETGEASPHERMLLSAGRDLDPPPGAQDKVWAALQVHIGPGGGGGGNGGGSGSGASGKALTNASAGSGSSGASISAAVGGAKAAIAAAAGALAVAGAIAAFVATSPPTPSNALPLAPAVVEPSAAAQAETATNVEPAVESPFVEPTSPPASSAILPPDTPSQRALTPRVSSAKPVAREVPGDDSGEAKQERASRLREENRMLGDARAALRNGDSASALEKLEAMGGQFPDGVLAQEREVLAIEALARAGNRSAAATRAAAFLAAHPTSPHAKKLRGFLQ